MIIIMVENRAKGPWVIVLRGQIKVVLCAVREFTTLFVRSAGEKNCMITVSLFFLITSNSFYDVFFQWPVPIITAHKNEIQF